MTTPLIIFSDHAAAQSGLARITRDLALRIHSDLGDQFKVATLGNGHPGSSQLPFPQYHWHQRDDFLPLELPMVWKDFCGDSPGVLLTIGDIQRFLPLADTKFASDRRFADWMDQMRRTGMLKLWGYFPIDAHGVGGKLGPQLGHTLSHYDRRLVPSEWAREIVRRTLPGHSCDVLPHGIDTGVFRPRDKQKARDEFGLKVAESLVWPQTETVVAEDALWVGIVATNQSRKDWPLGIETVAELRKSRPVMLWIHTDAVKREWSILELLSEFGLLQSSIVTLGNLSDEVMAECYSACDITLGIGRGEGFGYCLPESLACGTPCFSHSYGAQDDYLPVEMLLSTFTHRIEGPLNLLRPVCSKNEWSFEIQQHLEVKAQLPPELDWTNLWPRFAEWFRKGIDSAGERPEHRRHDNPSADRVLSGAVVASGGEDGQGQ